jgi:hypothetical protein
VRVQVVLHKDDLFRRRKTSSHSLHETAVIGFGSLLARFDYASARQWFKGDEQRAGSTALVFIINPLWLSGFHRQRHDHFAQELDGEFIEANNRALLVIGQKVEVQEVFHPRQILTLIAPMHHERRRCGWRQFFQHFFDCTVRDAFAEAEFDGFVRQEPERPTRMTNGSSGAGQSRDLSSCHAVNLAGLA